MAILPGLPVKAATDNAAFLSKTVGGDTVGVIGLKEPSTDQITDAQGYINKIADAVGVAGEADIGAKDYSSTNYISNGQDRKQAIESLDTKAKATQDQVDDHAVRIHSLESLDMTIAGEKTFSGNIIIDGDLTINGTQTIVNSEVLEVVDPLVTINNNGNDTTAEGSGLLIERDTQNAAFKFDSSLPSFFKIGLDSDLKEIIVSGPEQTIDGTKIFTEDIEAANITSFGETYSAGEVFTESGFRGPTANIDTIYENTPDAGVTVETVLIKDGLVDGRDVSVDGTNSSNHIANTSNPHGVTAAQAGADPVGSAATAIANHLAASDPHTQYAESSELTTHTGNTSNPHSVTKTQVGLSDVTNDAQLKRAAGDINSFTTKATPVSADVVLIEDSADSFNKKKVLVSSLGGSGGTPGGANTQVQFNDGGVFGGDSGLVYDKTLKQLSILNSSAPANLKIEGTVGAVELKSTNNSSPTITYFYAKDSVGASRNALLAYYNNSTLPNQYLLGQIDGNDIFKWYQSGSLHTLGILELGRLGNGDRNSYIDFHSSGSPETLDFSARIIRDSGINGSMKIQQTGTGSFVIRRDNIGLDAFIVGPDGKIYTPAIHNNSGGAAGSTPLIASGTYTPITGSSAYLNGASPYVAHWLRVGNVVHVAGKIDLWASALSQDTFIDITIPIARTTNFAAGSYQCGGNASIDFPDYNTYFVIKGVDGNNAYVKFRGAMAVGGWVGIHYHYTYLIS